MHVVIDQSIYAQICLDISLVVFVFYGASRAVIYGVQILIENYGESNRRIGKG